MSPDVARSNSQVDGRFKLFWIGLWPLLLNFPRSGLSCWIHENLMVSGRRA